MTHRFVPAIALLTTVLATMNGLAGSTRADSDVEDIIVVAHSHNGLCLDVEHHSQDEGANIIVYRCHGEDNQRWNLSAVSRDFFSAESIDSGLCLDIKNASTAQGAELIQYGCKRKNRDNQLFDFVSASRGRRNGELRLKHSNLCLDAGRDVNNAKVTQRTCNGSDAQQWTFSH